ncbi:MAG: Fe-S protein assembly chaperone HscA [Gammaproteobacteria bacterium]|nr:MAG: Fe-S protein assembly chaperone HscA [Gammaproteobacteria bacterium]
MALLHISEPGKSTNPHEHPNAAGIDLGTTNSLVATVRSGEAKVLLDEEGRGLLPSVVRFRKDDGPDIGYSALDAAVNDPMNTIASAKRMIGRKIADIKSFRGQLPYEFDDESANVPRILTVDGPRSAIEVSAEILIALKKRAEISLGGELGGVVITVPAYFDDAQRQATKDAAKLAGLIVMRLLNEPTAAAVAYGLDQGNEGIYAIYDLGGGTFDISILRLNKGVFEVLATAGDSALGGDDMDRLIAEWVLDHLDSSEFSINSRFLRQVLVAAQKAKEVLTEDSTATVTLRLPDNSSSEIILDRATMNDIIAPVIDSTLFPCRRALRDAGLEKDDLDGIVMVGGSTRVLSVQKKVESFFAQKLYTDVDPDQVVAIGAAIQADILIGNRAADDMLLLDVIPLSLGIEIMGSMVEKIIPRNATIPVSRAQEFTTYKDGQTAMSIHVVQGERELVSDCRSLARFELRGIPPMTAGSGRVKVSFQVDADGLLSVSAREATTGTKTQINVKPSYGLTNEEVEQMLRDSIAHAGDDIQVRQLAEQRVDADRAISALESALAIDGDIHLNESERSTLLECMKSLQKIKEKGDADHIKQAINELNELSGPFAARRMNASIREAMAGHNINEFSE